MVIITNRSYMKDVIMDYVALTCISRLENVFFGVMNSNSPLKKKLYQIDFMVPLNVKISSNQNKCINYTMAIVRFLHDTIYFYILPFFISVLLYLKEHFHYVEIIS